MFLWPALDWAPLPQTGIFSDDRRHKVVWLVQSLSWPGDRAGELVTEVGVVLDGRMVGPSPDVSVKNKYFLGWCVSIVLSLKNNAWVVLS